MPERTSDHRTIDRQLATIMADAPPKVSSFQIRSKPTKIRIVNPNTGAALETTSAPPPTRHFNSVLSKHVLKQSRKGTKETTRAPEAQHKTLEVFPPLATGKKPVKSATKGDHKSKPPERLPQQTLSKESKVTLADRSQDGVEEDKRPPHPFHEPQWKPDIYAHAYVPEAFLAVNKSPALLLSSTPVQAIDFSVYTSSFASPLFLPPLASPQTPSFDGALPVDSIYNLGIDNYEQHLSDCLVLDLESQIPEIRTYDMFGVQLGVIDRAQDLYSLHVDGLRENTPRVRNFQGYFPPK